MTGSPRVASIADLNGHELGRRRCSYTERDAILFALASGAQASDLRWVYEEHLEVMPTFAVTLGLWAVRAAGLTGAYDPLHTLHVGQHLRLHERLPPAADLDLEARIGAVWDKGSAALVEVAVTSAYFDAGYTIFVPGGGGFGGERGPSPLREDLGAPDWHTQTVSSPTSAALYRLTGDPHPVHIDPEVARASGFERPILHGLCTLAITTRTMAEAIGADLAALSYLSTRLTAPVYPGDPIEVSAWSRGPGFAFRAHSGEAVVLDSGQAEFTGR